MAQIQDPRSKNSTFDIESAHAYLAGYADALHQALKSVSAQAIDAAARLVQEKRQNGGRVFVAGNGGSSAIADHLTCDWQKGVHVPGHKCLHVHGLTGSTALLTAIANDYGYDKSFSFQLELAEAGAKDILILISASGNSDNIVRAAEYARSKGTKIVGMSGFKGGKLHTMADISLYVAFENYGVVEDAHQALMHVLAQHHDLTLGNLKSI
jgi:phosphoheptose isomerase